MSDLAGHGHARLICPEHGAFEILESVYQEQLSSSDAWRCPCGAACDFDDVFFEKRHGGEAT